MLSRKKTTLLGVAALSLVATVAQAQVTLTAKAGFGTGGWIAPVANSTLLDTGNNTRGFAYDSVTNQLIIVNRTGGNNVNLVNASTGALNGTMDGSGFTGGTFTNNMVASVGGKVYVANLSTSSTAPFKIYEFASATIGQTSTEIFNATSGLFRTGDDFDAILDANGRVAFAASGSMGTNAPFGYAYISSNGSSYSSTVVNGGMTNDGLRLGLTFGADENTVMGTKGLFTDGLFIIQNGVQLGQVTGLGTNSARPMDFAVVNGVPLLAVIDTVSSQVQVYDMTSPLAPVFVAQGNNTTGSLTANGNGVGQVKFGQDASGAWSLYAMSTNQGLQAFDVSVVPEPGTMLILAGAAAIAARRRRK